MSRPKPKPAAAEKKENGAKDSGPSGGPDGGKGSEESRKAERTGAEGKMDEEPTPTGSSPDPASQPMEQG